MGGVGNQIFAPAAFHLSGRFCRYGLEMLRISAFKYSKVIADTFIFEFGEIGTICGNRISNGKV